MSKLIFFSFLAWYWKCNFVCQSLSKFFLIYLSINVEYQGKETGICNVCLWYYWLAGNNTNKKTSDIPDMCVLTKLTIGCSIINVSTDMSAFRYFIIRSYENMLWHLFWFVNLSFIISLFLHPQTTKKDWNWIFKMCINKFIEWYKHYMFQKLS